MATQSVNLTWSGAASVNPGSSPLWNKKHPFRSYHTVFKINFRSEFRSTQSLLNLLCEIGARSGAPAPSPSSIQNKQDEVGWWLWGVCLCVCVVSSDSSALRRTSHSVHRAPFLCPVGICSCDLVWNWLVLFLSLLTLSARGTCCLTNLVARKNFRSSPPAY